MASDSVQVTVVYALPDRAWQARVRVPAGATLRQAVDASGFARAFPDVDAQRLDLGVYGERRSPAEFLAEGDRVELYRPLRFDPMESRRRRAAHRARKAQSEHGTLSNPQSPISKETFPMSDPVLFHTLQAENGSRIGVATLNRPESLNALSLPMCELLLAQLQQWQADASIVLVVLQGAGGKAFCAGGDLHSIYQHMREHQGDLRGNPQTRQFFQVEYTLDYLIHTYAKPVLVWGSGIVMGGGVGLMAGASHRVISETTRFAMPEVAIGLFPDVGGSWVLGHLPKPMGRFLAMTGAHVNASDTLFLGLADYWLRSTDWEALLADLQAQPWTQDAHDNGARLSRVIEAHQPVDAMEDGPLRQHADLIRSIAASRDFAEICARIAALQSHPDPWLQRAAKSLAGGAPGSVRLSFELQERARTLSLADVFRLEYIVVLHCAAHGDFQEGIRALLIDKDKTPRWNPTTLEAADRPWVEKFFQPPWPSGQTHPLAELGRDTA